MTNQSVQKVKSESKFQVWSSSKKKKIMWRTSSKVGYRITKHKKVVIKAHSSEHIRWAFHSDANLKAKIRKLQKKEDAKEKKPEINVEELDSSITEGPSIDSDRCDDIETVQQITESMTA